MADQPEKGEAVCECEHAVVAKTLQAVQPHLLVDPHEIKQQAGDLCCGLTNETANVEGEEVGAEMWPTAPESELWDRRGTEPPHAEDQKYNSQATVSVLLRVCATIGHDLDTLFTNLLL